MIKQYWTSFDFGMLNVEEVNQKSFVNRKWLLKSVFILRVLCHEEEDLEKRS